MLKRLKIESKAKIQNKRTFDLIKPKLSKQEQIKYLSLIKKGEYNSEKKTIKIGQDDYELIRKFEEEMINKYIN